MGCLSQKRGLPGGAEGIRTDGHRGRSEISSYSRLPLRKAVRVSTPVSDLGRDYRAKPPQDCSARTDASRERFSDRSRLVPAIGVFGETRALDTHDAEALAGRRFHHHPALKPICDLGAQLLQPRDFGGNIVGLDVDVDAALMLNSLGSPRSVRRAGSPACGNCRNSLDASGPRADPRLPPRSAPLRLDRQPCSRPARRKGENDACRFPR